MRHVQIAVVAVFALLLSCGKVNEIIGRTKKAPAPPPPAAPAPVASTPPPTADASAAAAAYSTEGLKTIPDDCAKAMVLLTTVPRAKNDKYPWTFARQALLAHPQFKIGSALPPKTVNTITLQQNDFRAGKAKPSKALVAICNNGATCNKLAAMYKNVVRGSKPDLFCENVPNAIREPGSFVDFGIDPAKDLPGARDVTAQCARLAACTIAADHNTPGDPSAQCQKTPADFKTQCALQTTCAAVLDCMKK